MSENVRLRRIRKWANGPTTSLFDSVQGDVRYLLSLLDRPVEADLPDAAVNPKETVKQHEYKPGGEFDLRVMESGYAKGAGVPFPPHIVYIDRDEQDRRRTTFVGTVYENAIRHAEVLVAAATPEADLRGAGLDVERLARAIYLAFTHTTAPNPDAPFALQIAKDAAAEYAKLESQR